MKAVILCAGQGTRLRPLTPALPKHMIPVANRPLVAYTFDLCRALGVSHVVLVLHPSMKDTVSHLHGYTRGFRLEVAYQSEPKGLADAVRAAAPLVGEEPFLLILGDTLISTEAVPQVRSAIGARHSCVFLMAVSDPRPYGVAELDDGRIMRLVEKSADPPSDLALIGLYLLEPNIFEAIDRITPSPRGELELTDAIDFLVRSSHRVDGHRLSGGWIDAGDPRGLLEANRMVLADMRTEDRGNTRVQIDPSALVSDSTLRGPIVIGPGTTIEHSTMEPAASVGARCVIRDSTVADSIVMDEVVLERIDAQSTLSSA